MRRTVCEANAAAERGDVYRWRKEYDGSSADELKRLKALEKENGRRRSAVSVLTLDMLILAKAAKEV